MFYLASHIYDKFYKEDKLDSLAYYFFLKKVFKRKPIFYNWTWKSLNKSTGISINTLKKHIGVLIEEGLVVSKDNHLHILTPKKKKKFIYIPIVKGIYNIKVVLKSLHLFCSLARQAKKIDKLNNPNAYKLLKKCNSTMGFLTLSNSTIATKIDRKSISTVQRRKEKLKELNILSWRYKYLPIEEYAERFGDPYQVLPLHRFKRLKGKLVVQISNHYSLSYFRKEYQYISSHSTHPKILYGLNSQRA